MNSKLKNKKYVLAAASAMLVALTLFFGLRPDRIFQLKNHFVQVTYDQETKQASFELSDARPLSWHSLDEISQMAAWAVVISEDWAFYEHEGVDFKQVQKALKEHMRGDRLRGASTLTQQLAKNLFLSHERSFFRKMREAGMALLMEQMLTKELILEHYLNVVEFGEGIYGIGMASKFYFDKKPSELNAKEGAFLAMLLPSPKKYAVSFEEKKMTDYAQQTIQDILQKLNQAKILDDSELQKEIARTLPFIKPEKPKKRVPTRQKKSQPVVQSTDFKDGRDFEKRYLNDPDLALAPSESFDPSKLEEVDLDVDVEFSLE